MATEEDGQSEYLACSTVYPAKELADEAATRGSGSRRSRPGKWVNWDAALSNVENQALVAFFESELEDGRESYLRKRFLRFHCGGKRRWNVAVRQKHAYVWQKGRFENDSEFWNSRVSQPEWIEPVKSGTCLRFHLVSKEDFEGFVEAVGGELQSQEWLEL